MKIKIAEHLLSTITTNPIHNDLVSSVKLELEKHVEEILESVARQVFMDVISYNIDLNKERIYTAQLMVVVGNQL
jgi:hypothetical protein